MRKIYSYYLLMALTTVALLSSCEDFLDEMPDNRTELDTIKQRFPDGLAVDMESAAIAQTCYLYCVQ